MSGRHLGIAWLCLALVGCGGSSLKQAGEACVASSECGPGLVCDLGQSPAVCASMTSVDAAVIDGPEVDAEGIDGPEVDGAMTDAPMTDAPMTDGPMTDGPMTDAPMVDAPMIDAPIDALPVDAPTDAPPDA